MTKPSDGPAGMWNAISVRTPAQIYTPMADEPRCELVIDPYVRVLLRKHDLQDLIDQATAAMDDLERERRNWAIEKRRRTRATRARQSQSDA